MTALAVMGWRTWVTRAAPVRARASVASVRSPVAPSHPFANDDHRTVRFGPRPAAVIIYLIDTLRSDRVSAYGGALGLTPNIDRLAAESVLFEQAYSCAPWTLPSVASIFTGAFATSHGITQIDRKLPAHCTSLAADLRRGGYACAAFVSNANTTPITSAPGGFELSRLRDKTYWASDVETWLDSIGRRPPFLYVHTTEPHNPYVAPPDWLAKHGARVDESSRAAVNDTIRAYRDLTMFDYVRGRAPGATDNTAEQQAAMGSLRNLSREFRSLYDAHVALADQRLGEFIELLRRRGIWDDCLFVLLSDHGEALGEHGGWLHDHALYEEVVRVPLLLRIPGGRMGALRVGRPVSLAGVAPAVRSLVAPRGVGRPEVGGVLSLIDGRATELDAAEPVVVSVRRNMTKFYRPWTEQRGSLNVAVRHGRWKAIWNDDVASLELYDLSADPDEALDVSATNPALAASLTAFARNWLAGQLHRDPPASDSTPSPTAVLDHVARNNLQTLGYLSD